MAMATAVIASCCATFTEISGLDAKPQAPLTMTRTPTPASVSSLCVSGLASRRASKPVRVRSIRTSTCDAPALVAAAMAASETAVNGRIRKSASIVLFTPTL